MDHLCCLFIFISLFTLSVSQPMTNTFNQTDFQLAISDMRENSYYGFAILLKMLNGTVQLNQGITFLMPGDHELSELSVSLDNLEDFLLSHSIPMPLVYGDLAHFPSGSRVPSGLHDRLIRITNRGRLDYFVNNAQIVTPNVCVNSLIRCHGVDAVIQFDNKSPSNEYQGEQHPTYATSSMHPLTAPVSKFSGQTKTPPQKK